MVERWFLLVRSRFDWAGFCGFGPGVGLFFSGLGEDCDEGIGEAFF